MNRYLKPLAVAGMAGALALSAVASSEARSRPWAAAGIGLAAGALIGAAAASAHRPYGYYGQPYAYRPGYAYGQGYAYGPGYGYAPIYAAAPWREVYEPYYDYEAHGSDVEYVVPGPAPVGPAPVGPGPSFAPGSYQQDLHGAGNT